MTPVQAITFVRKAVAAGRVEFSYHALHESMVERGLTVDDVLHVMENAEEAECLNDTMTRWKLRGPLPNGTDYRVVVFLKKNKVVIVVTAHKPP